jgi:hypothetical protein
VLAAEKPLASAPNRAVASERFRGAPISSGAIQCREHGCFRGRDDDGGDGPEEVFLGGHDAGVAGADGSDLFEATKTAIALERSYGMGEKLASYGDLRRRHIEGLGHVDPALLARVDSILQEQFDRAKNILLRYRKLARCLPTDSPLDWSCQDRWFWMRWIPKDKGELSRWSG